VSDGPASVLDAQVARFLRYLAEERRASPKTVETYGRDLRALAHWLAERPDKLDAARLDVRDLRAFLAETAKGREPATLIRKVAALRAMYRFLMKRTGLAKNPARDLRAPKLRRKLPRFLSVEKAAETVEAPTDRGTRATLLRDRAMLEVLYGSALRVSELSGLDLARVDLAEARALVRGKGDKERIVPLGEKAVEALRAYLAVRGELRDDAGAQDGDALFLGIHGSRLGVRQVQVLVKRYGEVATGTRAVHPHALRHSCATHLLDAGADLRSIQELLGHVSLSTTQRYTHVSMDQLRAVYAKAHPLARKPAGRREDVDLHDDAHAHVDEDGSTTTRTRTLSGHEHERD